MRVWESSKTAGETLDYGLKFFFLVTQRKAFSISQKQNCQSIVQQAATTSLDVFCLLGESWEYEEVRMSHGCGLLRFGTFLVESK